MQNSAEAILRLLDGEHPNWADTAEILVRDATLLYPLLAASASVAPKPLVVRSELSSVIEAGLNTLGTNVLRAWLLACLWPDTEESASIASRHARANAPLVAECARQLAIASDYPFPDEAYLAGILQALVSESERNSDAALDDLAKIDDGFDAERSSFKKPDSFLQMQRFLDGPFSPALKDALALTGATDEQLHRAHPLLRLLHSARLLVQPEWPAFADRISGLTGLPQSVLASLRAEAGRLAGHQPTDAHDGSTAVAAHASHLANVKPQAACGLNTLRDTAMTSLIRSAFDGLAADQISPRLRLACRLLTGMDAPVLVMCNEAQQLAPLAIGASPGVETLIAELKMQFDDEISFVALAARSGRSTSWSFESSTVTRSLLDTQIARALGATSFDCIPLNTSSMPALAIRAGNASPISPGKNVMALALCAAAVNALALNKRRINELEQLRREVDTQHRERARRTAHEVSNPLTVIRSYLEVIASRQSGSGSLSNEVGVISSEIDRIGALIKEAAQFTSALSERNVPTHCALNEVLAELQTLYARTLFEQRGIQFDLRVAANLPEVAMPVSKLKQILVNLFRNASEALQPGGRFSVVVPGQLISNGIRCVEIRLIDNGPGLAEDRLVDLFSPRPSSKGGAHEGIGLSLVREILDTFDGHILCRSQPGAGTSFQILVPSHKSS